jgi:protein O-mannosyl-transferase
MNPPRPLLACLLLLALGVAAYANSFSVPFYFDDEIHILENPYIQMPSLNGASLFRAMVQDGKQNRPFSNLTFALNYHFQGDRTWSYHLVNLALHLLAGLALFFCLRFTFRRLGWTAERGDLAALLSAAAFCVHPIQTEAVTYIVQRQTVMASAFMLCTILSYLAGRETPRRGRRLMFYLLAALGFFIAAGSKEIALVTPVLILLYEVYFFQDLSFAFLRRHPAAIILAILLLSGLFGLFVRPEIWAKIGQGYRNYPFTLTERLLTEPRVLFQYLGLLLLPLPSRLSLEHDPWVSTSLLSPWTTIPAILGWLILLAAAIRLARRPGWRGVSFALLWFLLNLSLESSFIPLDLMYEHRLYLPSLALIVPFLAGPVGLARGRRWPMIYGGLVILALLSGTIARNRVWQSPRQLWSDSIKKAPRRPLPWINLCVVQVDEADYAGAVPTCTEAITLNPNLADPYNALGVACFHLEKREEAKLNFEKAIALNPQSDQAYFNLGEWFLKEMKWRQAAAAYQRTLAVNPLYYRARQRLGYIYLEKLHQPDQAVAQFQELVKLMPNSDQAYYLLAQAFLAANDCAGAGRAARMGLRLNPDRPELLTVLRQCSPNLSPP